jgi:hypothetical protein
MAAERRTSIIKPSRTPTGVGWRVAVIYLQKLVGTLENSNRMAVESGQEYIWDFSSRNL